MYNSKNNRPDMAGEITLAGNTPSGTYGIIMKYVVGAKPSKL
jgi:hypothetical protein